MNAFHRFWRGFSRTECLVLSLCLAVLAYVAGGQFSSRKNQAELPPVFADAPQETKPSAQPQEPEPAAIAVHVAGAVRKPGVVNLSSGARVRDALHAAGGATDEGEVESINLADKLEDGQQVVIPRRGETSATADTFNTSSMSASDDAAEALPSSPVNVNTASSEQLEALPGIGPALAARIIKARNKKPFRSMQDLDEVQGLGPKKLEEIQPHVRF